MKNNYTANDYPILTSTYFQAFHKQDLSCRIILVDRGERGHGRYVTAAQYTVSADSADCQNGWEHGDYHCNWEDAVEAFEERVQSHELLVRTVKNHNKSRVSCVVCGETIAEPVVLHGHNPYPLYDTGYACRPCNHTVILPKRLESL